MPGLNSDQPNRVKKVVLALAYALFVRFQRMRILVGRQNSISFDLLVVLKMVPIVLGLFYIDIVGHLL